MRLCVALIGLIVGLSGADRAAARDEPAGKAASPSQESVHRLGSDAHQLRFEGENSAKTWTIYVTSAQAQTRSRLRVSYSNAISVMPEVSMMAISVNDIAVAQTPIAAASDPGGIDIELPRGLLAAGYNTIRIAVTQRHRVDCSLEATYELWTQLDPASSGLTFPGLADVAIDNFDDLAAISPDASGAVPIRAVLPDDADQEAIDRTLTAVEAVVIRAGIIRPNVEIFNAIDDRPGLWVLAGLQSDLRARGFGRFLGDAALGPALAGSDVPGRTIVVAAGIDGAQTDQAISQILPPRRVEKRTATSSAARALEEVSGFPVAGDMRVSLHDLGAQTEEFNGRLFRSSFDIQLPPDFYPADYDKLTLLISAGYSSGLSSRAQILVRVNEMEAGSLPLRNPKGDLFRDRAIVVSLAALRPGINHIVIEAQTPTPEDAACEVRGLMDPRKRFVLFDRSQLSMPAIARIVRMPNLAVTMGSGFPYVSPFGGRLFLAKHDRATIGAAATFLARTAFVARRLLKLRTTFDIADANAGSVVLLGAYEDFAASVFERVGVNFDSLKEAWSRPRAEDGLTAQNAKAPADSAEAAQGDLYDEWAQGVRDAPADFNARATLRGIYDRYINVHRGDFQVLRNAAAKIDVPAKATLLIAQARGPMRGPDTWTLVVAANSAALTRDMHGLVAPSNWNQVEGRAAAFDEKSGAANVAPAIDSYFIETASLTPGNLRLVAAGWLSSNIDYYVLAVTIGAIVLGVLTSLTVRSYGARG